VKQAMIGGTEAKHQGPWPVCVGISGKDCQHLIESFAEDVRGHVFIKDPDMVVSTDFDTTRVLIWVDEDGIVTKIPKRG
jgi:Potato inhibitor I family